MSQTTQSESERYNENLSSRPYNVLVVEDNADDVELFLRALRRVQVDTGIEITVRSFSDSAEATAQIKEEKFDAVFLDINMPSPDGIELTRRIRSSEKNRTTPIVIITGTEDRGTMALAFQAGANFFLYKPVDRMRLLRLIQVSRAPIDRERRRLQRVTVKCKVSIESAQSHIEGETIDLSLSGMLVRASSVLPVGALVNLSVFIPPATTPIRTTARVVRMVGDKLMGLQFERIGTTESEKMAEFLVPLIVDTVEKGK